MLDRIASKPVFIVGMNGSGTTLLLDCLNNHDELYGFVWETKLIPYFLKTLHKYGDLSEDRNFLALFNEFRQLSLFKYANKGTFPPLPENWRDLPRNLASVVDSVMSYFANQEKKVRWCEKSPMYAQHIKELSELFPGAKFIHVIRDGRACAASFYRRFHYTPQLTMYRWKKLIGEARRQGQAIEGRYMEVHYEALVEYPAMTMRSICTFLDIPYSDQLLLLSRKRTFTGSDFKKITLNRKSWTQILSSRQLKKMEAIGGKLLAKLGHDTDFPLSDHDPAKIMIKMWLYLDYARRGIDTLYTEIRRPKDKKWDDISAIFIRSIKQILTTKY